MTLLYYIHSFEVAYLNCSSYVAHKNVMSIVPIFLLSVGTFGNMMSFYILCHKTFRLQSVYIYLAVLSLADTGVLYIGLFPDWLDNVTGFRPTEEIAWLCKLSGFCQFTMSHFSVWLIVAVTVERYLATTQTIAALTACSKTKAKLTILLMLVVVCLLNSHVFSTMSVDQGNGTSNNTDDVMSICAQKEEFDYFFDTVWPWVDACIYSLVPFLVITFLNTAMIISVRKSTYQRNSVLRRRQKATKDGVDRKLTVMLLSVSFIFIITTIPVNMVWVAKIFLKEMKLTICQVCTFKLCDTIAKMLMYTNHSVNFFLYLLSGKKFRMHLTDCLWPTRAKVEKIVLFYKRKSFLSNASVESNTVEIKM